ncbi:MAG TPA: AAA family ATPase, partial [Acidimicrobiales bacterium]|nr:AAA family ATPase [Acidimicrobiales bacterium]
MRRETWPLVGRADELAYVARSLEEGRGVLLAGAAGVGKSRLASEVVASMAEDGWSTVAVSVGTESASAPFSPFAALLSEGELGDGVDRIVRATHAIEARGERVLVSVDDAHLLDDVSVAFLRHLLTATTARLLLTVRSGTPAPEGLQSMWQSGDVHRIEVQPLSRPEVADLLDRVLAAPVDLAVTRWVWVTSEGNPL